MSGRILAIVACLYLVNVHPAFADAVLCVGNDLEKAEEARVEARQALQSMLRYMQTNDKSVSKGLVDWFGSSDPVVKQAVEVTLNRAINWIDAFNFYCHYNNDGIMVSETTDTSGNVIRVDLAGSLYAYVYPADMTKLYLGLAFYESAANGYNSRLGTVIHELTHFTLSGRTNDEEYGLEKCRALARENPSAALKNADSYQYFVESWLSAR